MDRRGGKDSPQLLVAKILLRILTHWAAWGGAGPKGPLGTSRRFSPPEPPCLGKKAADGEGKVSAGWPKAPLTVTVSEPRNPSMLPVPYWMDRGWSSFRKVEDLDGLKRRWISGTQTQS